MDFVAGYVPGLGYCCCRFRYLTSVLEIRLELYNFLCNDQNLPDIAWAHDRHKTATPSFCSMY
jgi:hypothetical protein